MVLNDPVNIPFVFLRHAYNRAHPKPIESREAEGEIGDCATI